jgi:hypothetical protein
MSVPKPKYEDAEPKDGPAVPRERVSADYERPREDVAEMPEPVVMPTNKARAGETRGHMRIVLIIGIALAILAFLFGYVLAF